MIIALDLSSTSTGVCVDNGDIDEADDRGVTNVWQPKGPLLARARVMRDNAVQGLRFSPELAVIEGIGTRHTQTAIAIAYVHALVLDAISDQVPVLTVPPAALKKFATGKGNADKDAMLVAAIRAGSDAETNDAADAFWLWCIGHSSLGAWKIPQTAYRTTVLADLGAK